MTKLFDDTLRLSCSIETHQSVRSHIEYRIRVQRGDNPENSWILSRRYSDFASLDDGLKDSGISLSLPPKKVFGNKSRELIAERQQKLQAYLNEVLGNWILANCLYTKQFLYDDSYRENLQELALQHISMLLRSEPSWEVVEPLTGIGSRIRKTYCLAKDKASHKKCILTWCSTGPYATIEEKERSTLIKSLETLQHAYLVPVDYCACSTAGAMIIRSYMEKGSLRDQLYKTKPKTHHLKKYGSPKSFTPLELSDIRKYGRQILEIIKYMTDKGFPLGHVNLGNIFIEDGTARLSDIENFILGVPPYYRTFLTYHKKCNTLEALNSYAFGHLLYEMVFGMPLNKACYETLPGPCGHEIGSILTQLLSSESLKSGIPSIEDLLALSFFSDIALPAIPKPVVKFPSKLKENLRSSKCQFEQTLKEEQRLVSQIRKRNKAHAYHMTDEEKRKRKISQKKSVAEDPGRSSLTTFSMSGDGKTDMSSSNHSVTAESVPAPSGPPSAPAPPPPPPPPSAAPASAPPKQAPPKAASSRNALLDSIGGFSKGKLKKSVTVDKSAPKV